MRKFFTVIVICLALITSLSAREFTVKIDIPESRLKLLQYAILQSIDTKQYKFSGKDTTIESFLTDLLSSSVGAMQNQALTNINKSDVFVKTRKQHDAEMFKMTSDVLEFKIMTSRTKLITKPKVEKESKEK